MRIFIGKSAVDAMIANLTPNQRDVKSLGFFTVQQIKDRHKTQGASGGRKWPAKKIDDGRAILTGPTGAMLESWFSYAEDSSTGGRAIIANPMFYSYVQELGTRGKGGTLPDIKPKKAKALFIPITDRARTAIKIGLVRTATRGRKDKVGSFFPLVKGRLKNGKLEKWDARKEEWVSGIPDFIFLKKVSIPPRPQLPTSQKEILEQGRFLSRVLTGKIQL